MSENLLKYVQEDLSADAGAMTQALVLFLRIEKHHGEAAARQLFVDLGRPSRTRLKLEKKHAILRRYDMMPKKNQSALAAQIAVENKELPKEERGGAGGTNPLALYKFIDRARAERDEAMKAGTWKGPVPAHDGSDIFEAEMSGQFLSDFGELS
jgi:hypothetical protein